jgi:hypothetical protein
MTRDLYSHRCGHLLLNIDRSERAGVERFLENICSILCQLAALARNQETHIENSVLTDT